MGLDDNEKLGEEPTQEEIAEACSEVLDPEICDEIAEQESTEEALSLAFAALIEVVDDPEEYLKMKGILG